MLKITEILYSRRTQEEIFKQTMADWDLEIYKALPDGNKYEIIMINTRNIYRFVLTMWQKSPIGNLIEFVIKIAKP